MEEKQSKHTLTSQKRKMTEESREDELARKKLSQSALKNNLSQQIASWDGLTALLTFAVPFAAMTTVNIQAALYLILLYTVVIIPVALLHFALYEKVNIPMWICAPICIVVALGILSSAKVFLRVVAPAVGDTLGIYVYLLSAYTVVLGVFIGKKAKKTSTVLLWSLRNIVFFIALIIPVALIRELLSNNRVLGNGAKTPFVGLILMAFMLAAFSKLRLNKTKTTTVEPTESEV